MSEKAPTPPPPPRPISKSTPPPPPPDHGIKGESKDDNRNPSQIE